MTWPPNRIYYAFRFAYYLKFQDSLQRVRYRKAQSGQIYLARCLPEDNILPCFK